MLCNLNSELSTRFFIWKLVSSVLLCIVILTHAIEGPELHFSDVLDNNSEVLVHLIKSFFWGVNSTPPPPPPMNIVH